MKCAVVFPYRASDEHRERAFEWTRAQFEEHLPGAEHVIGECPDGPYNRSYAIIDGVLKTDAEVLAISDADCWCSSTPRAVEWVSQHGGWSVPHNLIWRLSQDATQKVVDGKVKDPHWFRAAYLSQDNVQDRAPYVGNECGTLLIIRREVLLSAPPDVRMVGWGQEDVAWAYALRATHGRPRRYPQNLVHLWHPPQPRRDRHVGSEANLKLLERYRSARSDQAAMQQLVAEARESAGLDVGSGLP